MIGHIYLGFTPNTPEHSDNGVHRLSFTRLADMSGVSIYMQGGYDGAESTFLDLDLTDAQATTLRDWLIDHYPVAKEEPAAPAARVASSDGYVIALSETEEDDFPILHFWSAAKQDWVDLYSGDTTVYSWAEVLSTTLPLGGVWVAQAIADRLE